MIPVRAKKALGQHFLTDEAIALRITEAFNAGRVGRVNALEIGPGTGVLTKYLLRRGDLRLKLVELDGESADYLSGTFALSAPTLIRGDFLRLDPRRIFDGAPYFVIGNFPYNISSQIFFKILDVKDLVGEIVCMLQREVALRLASGPGNKDYGILSVFLQAYYDVEYLFGVDETVFAPPPKVKSGVIRLRRNGVERLACDEDWFRRIVKTTFNQRRKTIWNGLKPLGLDLDSIKGHPFMTRRPETLSVAEFVELCLLVSEII